MSRNPPWSRDELILALDLYFREPAAQSNGNHPACLELSDLLNKLPLHPATMHSAGFRNSSGVGMKLGNFRACDPSYTGKGLESGSKLDKVIWDEFSRDIDKLKQTANAIRENYADLLNPGDEEVLVDEEGAEGRVLLRIHQRRERNRALVEKKKRKVLKETGKLACEVCDFDFAMAYGDLGKGFAECHHDRPVSEMSPGEKTKTSELRIVCANCHRMIHRARPWITALELRKRTTKTLTRKNHHPG
jgi:5-methylcytosine-specific restriction enzyme A